MKDQLTLNKKNIRGIILFFYLSWRKFMHNIDKTIHKYRSWYEWRSKASKKTMIGISFLFACITGLLGQISITIPFTNITTTFQVFAVLMAGVMLGEKYGGLSMVIFMVGGILGIPWFSYGGNGLSGAVENIGFLSGFIFSATFTGYVFDHYELAHRPIISFLLILFADIVLIHTCGTIGLFFVMLRSGYHISLINLLIVKFIPDIIRNILESFFTTILTIILLPADKMDKKIMKKRGKT